MLGSGASNNVMALAKTCLFPPRIPVTRASTDKVSEEFFRNREMALFFAFSVFFFVMDRKRTEQKSAFYFFSF